MGDLNEESSDLLGLKGHEGGRRQSRIRRRQAEGDKCYDRDATEKSPTDCHTITPKDTSSTSDLFSRKYEKLSKCRWPSRGFRVEESFTKMAPFSSGYLFQLLFFTIIISLVCTVSSYPEEELFCIKGVSGFAGATFPKGDIYLKENDTLEVYCKLNLTQSRGYNASFIQFIITKSEIPIPRDAMKTTVVNETTALLRIENMNVSSPSLSCEIVPPGASPNQHIPVCHNEVDVGYPPQLVEDFRCYAHEWTSLNCTWRKPFNPIPTNYVLQIVTKYHPRLRCPNATHTSCVWGLRTEPFYMPNLKTLHFQINGTNVLQPNGTIQSIDLDHWAIVVPSSPTNLKSGFISPNSITVSWHFNHYKDFAPGLFHEVKICVQDFPTVPCNTTLKSSKSMEFLEQNIQLEYAYVNYTVQIRMRSQRAKDEEDFWSNPATIVVMSPPKSPDSAPNVDLGSYESVTTSETHGNRDVYVYWEGIERLRQNGPDFHYLFEVYEDETLTDIQPKEISQAFAKFSPMGLTKSYRIVIRSANSVGNSSSVVVLIPKNNKIPDQPRSVSKLDYTNDSFEVSWHRPEMNFPILSYTVFRCASLKPRPYQCQGPMQWDVVSSTKDTRKLYNYLPPHKDLIYQFGVSANSEHSSSGIVWASCSLIHNKVPDKLKKVKTIREEEKEILIEWQLDCLYQPGVIEGFKITYCLVYKSKPEKCKDGDESEAVQGANKTTYLLKKLKPYSMYMIAVSVITLAGESQKSDPIFASTKESAPDPPIAVLEKVTNTSGVIKVQPPATLNGLLRNYKINYKSTKDPTLEFAPVEVPWNSTSNDSFAEVVIRNLESNSNYSLTVSACTSRCSDASEPVYFVTKIGRTNMKNYPSLVMSEGSLIVEWGNPHHVGGPVKHFEILLKRNGKGKEVEPEKVEFQDGTLNYQKKLKFSCETDTNLTAQVRAVTELETGDLISGDWSPPGNFNCGGGTSWVMWMIVVVAAIITVILIGIGSMKIYQYLKEMKEFEVKLPPGMAVQDLNGFSHKHPKRTRKNSEGDTQSFGKENATYQMTSTNHADESKDFLSLTESSLRERETGFSFELESNPENKATLVDLEKGDDHETSHKAVCAESVSPSCPSSASKNVVADDLFCLHAESKSKLNLAANAKAIATVPVRPFEQPSCLRKNVEDCLTLKRLSPSPTKPLLDDSQTTDEEDLPILCGSQPTRNQSRHNHRSPQVLMGNGLHNHSVICNPLDTDTLLGIGGPRPVPIASLVDDFDPSFFANGVTTVGSNVPDVLTASTNASNSLVRNGDAPCPTHSLLNGATGSAISNTVPPPPVSSSYVKWTQLMPELKNGDSSLGIGDNARRSPYCQVGILLDSN